MTAQEINDNNQKIYDILYKNDAGNDDSYTFKAVPVSSVEGFDLDMVFDNDNNPNPRAVDSIAFIYSEDSEYILSNSIRGSSLVDTPMQYIFIMKDAGDILKSACVCIASENLQIPEQLNNLNKFAYIK